MRWKAVIVWSAIALFGLANTASEADLGEEWRNWSHSRAIEVGEVVGIDAASDLAAIPVSRDFYDHAQSDLSDVRIVDASGEEAGYVVFASGSESRTAWREASLSDTGFVAGEYTQAVADAGAGDELHNELGLRLGSRDRDFFSWVEVAASADRETWRIVRERAPIYSFRDNGPGAAQTALRIRYPETRDRWLRVRVLSPEEEVPVEGVRVRERVEEARELLPVAGGVSLSPDSPEDESWWTTAGGVPISAVKFETDRKAFHRPVVVSVSDDGGAWRQVARGLIYRYPEAVSDAESGFSEPARESTRIEFDQTAASHWRIAVRDRNDPPIPDLTVTLERAATSIVFLPRRGATYRLLLGNHRAEKPSYELPSLATREQLAAAVPVGLGPLVENAAYLSPEPFTERHPVILWLALGLVVAVLSWMAVKTLK